MRKHHIQIVFSLDQPDSLLSFRQVRDSSRPNWKPPTAIQGRADNCDSRIEGSAIARKYCHSERHISSQRASPTARLQGSGGQLPRNALAVTVKLLVKSRLPDTRYLVWIDRNLNSTLQDRHRTHAATLRVGKAQKSLHCRPLATHGRAAGPRAVQGCGRRLDRNDTQQQ